MHPLVKEQSGDAIGLGQEVDEEVFEGALLDRVLEEVIAHIECGLLAKCWLVWDRTQCCEMQSGVPFSQKHPEHARAIFDLTVEESEEEWLQLDRVAACLVEDVLELLELEDPEHNLRYCTNRCIATEIEF